MKIEGEFLRRNFSSPTLWHWRRLCAATSTGCVTVSIEDLNRIDEECASDTKEANLHLTTGQGVPCSRHNIPSCLACFDRP
jgi:hypothetical protein